MYARLRRPLAERYGFLLLIIVADYIMLSALSGSVVGSVLGQLLLGYTLLIAVLISHARRLWFLLAVALVIVQLCVLAGLLLTHNPHLAGVISAVGACLLLMTPIAILRDIITHKIVTISTVLGAACTYLLLGVCFALIFATVGAFSPTSFFLDGQAETPSNYLFFSFTTLTTVGYGNLIPASNLGQSLAVIEALGGQIFLVVVVARLVSLWGQEIPRYRRRERADGDAGDQERPA